MQTLITKTVLRENHAEGFAVVLSSVVGFAFELFTDYRYY